MTKTRKNLACIILSILAVVLITIGSVFAVLERKNRTTASAVENTSESLYFGAGASARVNVESSKHWLLFYLYVTESAFADSDTLTVVFADEYENVGFRFMNGPGADTEDFSDTSTRTLTKSKSELDFSSGTATLYIGVQTELRLESRLIATIGTNVATSDARSVFYIWQRMVENNFAGENYYTDEEKNYIISQVNFDGNVERFSIAEYVRFFVNDGITITLNIPQDYFTNWLSQAYDGATERVQYSLVVLIYNDEGLYTHFPSVSPGTWNSLCRQANWYYQTIPDVYIDSRPLSAELIQYGVGEMSLDYHPANPSERTYITAAIVRNVYKKGIFNLPGWSNHNIAAMASNYISFTGQELAEKMLAKNVTMSDEARAQLQHYAGIAPAEEQITVNVQFKQMNGGVIGTATDNYLIPGLFAQNKEIVLSYLYQLKDKYKNLASFNVINTEDCVVNGKHYETYSRIILQTKGTEYAYDSTTEIGTLTVVYYDYQYKDFALRVRNNDPTSLLALDYYTTDVVDDGSTVTLKYSFEDIKTQIYGATKWSLKLTKDNFVITGQPENIVSTLTDDTLSVTLSRDAQNSLVGMQVQAVAEIVPDTEYIVTYQYVTLIENGSNVVIQEQTSEQIIKMYLELSTLTYVNFMSEYGEEINAAVSPAFLGGVTFATPKSIDKTLTYCNSEDHSECKPEEHTCVVTVVYDYRAIFAIEDNVTNDVRYKALYTDSLNYKGTYFVEEIPDGYYVKSISSESSAIEINSARDYKDTRARVTITISTPEVIPVTVEFCGEWNLVVKYLEDYEDLRIRQGKSETPCFAVLKTHETTVKVSDVADITALTEAELCGILGKSSLRVLGLADVDKITMSFDGVDTYTATVSYGKASLKQIDYNGTMLEIEIPLTSFADWCNGYGQDWSILFLNMPDRVYFETSNEVEAFANPDHATDGSTLSSEDYLYGFFSVAIFSERITDLNYYFKNVTGDGCVSFYEASEIHGDVIYNFFGDLALNGNIFTAPLGYVGMALCETVNNDNSIYYSNFFYLDGTSTLAYVSNGGADNADDTDSAIENAGQDFGEWVDGLMQTDGMKVVGIILGAIAGVIVIVFVVSLCVKIVAWVGAGSRSGKRSKKRGKKKEAHKR